MKHSVFVLLFLTLVSVSFAGRITPWGDPDVFYPNSGYIKSIDLFFTLDNKLPAGHIMRIQFPFSTAPSFVASSPIIVFATSSTKGTWYASNVANSTNSTTGSLARQNGTASANNYFSFGADLLAGQAYVARVYFLSSPTDVGLLGYIQMETMSPALSVIASGGSDTAITYDMNNAFASLHICAAPLTPGLAMVADTNATVAGQASVRQFRITPSQNFFYWPTIVISWGNSAFTASNLQSIDIGTVTGSLTPLTQVTTATTAGQFSYTLGTTSVTIQHNAPLNVSQVLIYNLTMANPSTTQAASYTVMIYHRYNYNLTDYTSTGTTVQVTSNVAVVSPTPSINNQNILLSWGIDRSAATITGNSNWQKAFTLWAHPAANPQYQAMSFGFGLNASMSSGSYTLDLTVCATAANCDVLENSIVTNLPGASCQYIISTASYIRCTMTGSPSTSGNYIAARILLIGVSVTTGNMLTYSSPSYSIADSNFGTMVIYNTASPTTGTNVTTTGQASSAYLSVNYNTCPLSNINGNGPMTALPTSGLAVTGGGNYATLWNAATSGVAAASSSPAGFPTSSATATQSGGTAFGGIYGVATASTKYNVALFTTAKTLDATRSDFTNAAAASTVGLFGIDVFLNPNVYANAAGTTTNQITTCYVSNVPGVGASVSMGSSSAQTVGSRRQLALGLNGAYCFTSLTSGYFLRLRYATTTSNTPAAANANFGIAAAAGVASSVLATSTPASQLFMTFYWESAFSITAAYAGASLRADSNIGDFYAILYTATYPSTKNPVPTGTTGQTDIGDLSTSNTNYSTITYGTGFFWTQMILGPYGAWLVGSTGATPYFQYKSVFLSNYNYAAGSYTSSKLIYFLRIRGVINSTSTDANIYPTGGKIALFLAIPNTGSSWEGLAGAGFYTSEGLNKYRTQVPQLANNNSIRCWNSQTFSTCTIDRKGRALPSGVTGATTTSAQGITNTLDQYQIISVSSDVTYTSNFSVVILLKPIQATNLEKYTFRMGFQSTSSNQYYIQSWDQWFENAATLASGVYSQVAPGTALAAPTVLTKPATDATCVLPYTSAGTTSTSMRITPATSDTVNSVVTGTLSINNFATNTPVSRQGSMVWCGQWNFRASTSFATGSLTSLEGGVAGVYGDKCMSFDYVTIDTAGTTAGTPYYCVYCPNSNQAPPADGASSLSLTLSSFTTGLQTNILTGTFDIVADDLGKLVEMGTCSTFSGPGTGNNPYYWLPQTITSASASGTAYNLPGQKLTLTVTAPSTLSSTVVDNVQFIGKYANTTSDSNWPYATLDTNAVCRLVPGGTVNTNYTSWIACTPTVSGGTITVTTANVIASTGYTNTTNWAIYIWGLNGNSSTNTTSFTTSFVVQTYKGSTLVDQSTNSTTGVFNMSVTAVPILNFTTQNAAYQRPIIGARGWFRFEFIFSSRTWFNTDKIILNLDSFVTTGVNTNSSVLRCRITDLLDVIQQIFQSCTLSLSTTPPTVTIIALPQTFSTTTPYDFTASNGFRIYIDNTVTTSSQSNRTINGNVYFAAGGTSALNKNATGSEVSAAALTTAQTFPTGYPNLVKYFAAPNGYQDMIFTLQVGASFNSSGRITIVFPSYYNPGLTTKFVQPYCTLNSLFMQCQVGTVSTLGVATLESGSRTLVLTGSPTSIANGGTFQIKVGGIQAPAASYVTENFWIAINGDNTEAYNTILYAGAMSDLAYGVQTVAPINVNWFTIGSTNSRTTATFTWTFGVNSTTNVTTTHCVQAIFPESWGLAWGVFTPTCTLYDFQNNSLVFATSQSIFGNLVQLNVSTAIPNADVVTLSCLNVRTPDLDITTTPGSYYSRDIIIRIADANGTNVYQKSTPGVHNVNFNYGFTKVTTLSYTTWTKGGSPASPIALTAGTFSASVTVTVPSRSSRTFTITPTNTNFAFLSSAAPFYVSTGATSNTTVLGCAGTVPIGLYALTFTITDSTAYTVPPVMWVQVNTNPITITPSTTSISTYYETSTLSNTAPVTFDTSAFPPFSDITITPVPPTGNTNFTFSPASIRLTAAAPKNWFVFTSTASATGPANVPYTFTISGTNAASYVISSAVTVSLVADSTGVGLQTPVLVVSADGTDTSAATSKTLTFTLTQVAQATIYWVVTLQGQSITDATTIINNAANLLLYTAQSSVAYNPNSANQAQYFTTIQIASPSKSPANVAVGNLFPGTGYTVTAVAVSNTNKTSTVASFTFVTGVNAASIQRWLFNYTTYPSAAQRQTLLCSITQTISVPAVNVRSVNGEICGNTTAFYNSSNSTGDLAVYFYPLQATTDTVMINLQTLLNTTTIMGALNTSLVSATGGVGFLNALTDGNVKNIMPVPTFPSSASVGQQWAQISGISLNDTGFVFLAIGSNTTSAPTPVAFKQAAAGILTNTGLSQIQVIYYYPGSSAISYNFTGLSTATTYNVFMLASNNDPSFLQNFTSVTTLSITTASTSSTTGSPIGVVMSVMAVFASVISLLFI